MNMLLLCQISHAGLTAQLDFTPLPATDDTLLTGDVVNETSIQAHSTFTPWIGFQSENWLILSSIQYNIWEYRSWSQEDQELENLGQIQLQQQIHRLWLKDDFLGTIGLGIERSLAVSNRASSLFTEEEQEDYDEQTDVLKDQIENLGFSAHCSVQYPLQKSIFLGLGYDSYALFQQRDHNGLLELNMRIYSQPKLFFRTLF
jgi:hypothetical protein